MARWTRFRRLFGLEPAADVDAELAFHVEMRTRELIEHGETPERARQLALRRFGDYQGARDECVAINERRRRHMQRAEFLTELKQDVGYAFRARVTATNGVAPNGVAFTPLTARVTQAPFDTGQNGTVLPSIEVAGDGIPDRGDTITGRSGTWLSYPAPVLRHQWQRCDVSGNACTNSGDPISTQVTTTNLNQHQSSSTYVITDADLGFRIRLLVTAQVGSGPLVSPVPNNVLTAPARGAPVNVAGQLPSITGTPVRGQTLSAASGLWTGFWAAGQQPLVLTHQWQRCPADGNVAGCVNLGAGPVSAPLAPAGAATCTSAAPCSGTSTYALTDADMGARVRVLVRATNGSGQTVEVASPLTALVQGAPQILSANGAPDPNAQPTISGIVQSGLNVGASSGSWSAFPGGDAITYAYQWMRCSSTDVASCAPIAGATATIYTVQDADVGQRLRIRITATNGVAPAGVAFSAPSEPVKARSAGAGGDGVDLILSASASSSGGTLTYTLKVTNAGNRTATGVAVSATPSGGASVTSASAPGGCSGSSPISCSLGSLGAGASASATVVVQASQTGVVSLNAGAGSAEADVNPSNNSVSLSSFLVVTGSAPKSGGGGGGGGSGGGGVSGNDGSSPLQNTGDQRFVALKDVKLKARRVGKTWVVNTTFTLIQARSDLRLVVTKNGSDKELQLLEGSRFGDVVVEGSSEEVAFTSRPATFPIRIVLSARGFSLQQVYVIRISATANGRTGNLSLGFKGVEVVKKTAVATQKRGAWTAASRFRMRGKGLVQAWVPAGGSKRLSLLKGSTLGTARAKKSGNLLGFQATKAGIVPVRILLADRGFSLRRTYVIHVQTKAASGIWTDYQIRFKGKAPARVLADTP